MTTIGRDPGPTKFWQAEVSWTTKEASGYVITDQSEVQRAVAELIDGKNELGIESVDPEFGVWNIEIYDYRMAELIIADASAGMDEVQIRNEEYMIRIPLR